MGTSYNLDDSLNLALYFTKEVKYNTDIKQIPHRG